MGAVCQSTSRSDKAGIRRHGGKASDGTGGDPDQARITELDLLEGDPDEAGGGC